MHFRPLNQSLNCIYSVLLRALWPWEIFPKSPLCFSTLACVCVSVCVCALVCEYVCSRTGLSERNRKKSQSKLTQALAHKCTCCLCFTCKHTGVIEWAVGILSALKVLYLRRLRAPALIIACVCVCVRTCFSVLLCVCLYNPVHICVCMFEKIQTGPWDCSVCVFWLCQADHYYGVEGQVVWPEGPDKFVCLN